MLEELLEEIHQDIENMKESKTSEQQFIDSLLKNIYQYLYKIGLPVHTIGIGILRGNTFDMYYKGRILNKYKQMFGAMSYDATIAGRACELFKKNKQLYLHLHSRNKILEEFKIHSKELSKIGLKEEAKAIVKRSETIVDQGIGSYLLIPIAYGNEIIGIFTISSIKESEPTKLFGEKIEEKFISISQMLGLILFMEKISYNKSNEMSRLLISSIDAIDEYQATHSLNVRTMIDMFIDELSKDRDLRDRVESIGFNLTVDKIENIRSAALLHDIGKVFIPKSILRKSSLDSQEMLIRKMHSYCTYNMLISSKTLRDISDIASMHHARYYIPMSNECLDEYAKVETSCVGYPFDIFGQNNFSPESQIIALADTFNAIVRARPEGEGLSFDQAIEILEKEECKFHGGLRDIFLTVVKRVEANIRKGVYTKNQEEEYRSSLWLDKSSKELKMENNKWSSICNYLKNIKLNNMGIIVLLNIKNKPKFLSKNNIKIEKKDIQITPLENNQILFSLINIPKDNGFIWIKYIFQFLKDNKFEDKIALAFISNRGKKEPFDFIYNSLINGLDEIQNEPVHYYLDPIMYSCE